MGINYEEKALGGLTQLELKEAAQQLDAVAQKAAVDDWSYTHF